MTNPHPGTSDLYLDDGATTYAPGSGTQLSYGHVGGTAKVFSFGTAQWNGYVNFEPSVLKLTAGDEQYLLTLEGNSAADFSGASQDLVTWNLRALNPQDVVVATNNYQGTIYPYGRLKIATAGTSPQIKLVSFLTLQSAAAQPSLAEALTNFNVMAANYYQAVVNLRAWMTGTADGGPSNDGKYPVSDGQGSTTYLECLAKLVEMTTAGSFDNATDLDFATKAWKAANETSAKSLADRRTANLITTGYGGQPGAVAGDDTVTTNAASIQAALGLGGVTTLPPGKQSFSVKDDLLFSPGTVTLDLNTSQLAWDNAAMFTDPASMPELTPASSDWLPGLVDNFAIWRFADGNLELIQPGPNLVVDPRFTDGSTYFKTSAGPNGLCDMRISSDTADGAYTTTDNNGNPALHKVLVMEASATVSGTAAFGSMCLVDVATHSNLKAVPVTGGKRYSIGFRIRQRTGSATGASLVLDFSNDSSDLGPGSNVGLTVNGNYVETDGANTYTYVYTNVDAPSAATWMTPLVTVLHDSTSTAAAAISLDHFFCIEIDAACDIFPNYKDDVDNDGSYALIAAPLTTMTSLNGKGRFRVLQIEFNITDIDQEGTQKYVTACLRPNGRESGTDDDRIITVTDSGPFSWVVRAPSNIVAGQCCLTLQSNNTVKIDPTSITIKELPENFGILVQAADSDPTFDHAPHSIRDGYLQGPNLPYSQGILFDTPADNHSSQGAMWNIQCFGFGIPRVLQTQAYLLNDFNCTWFGLTWAEQGIPSENSGEQILSYGSRFSGGTGCIWNCSERRLFGGSLDYPVQTRFVRTSNTFESFGTHYEGNKSADPSQIPFVVDKGGAFRPRGGKIEFSGVGQDSAPVMPYLIQLNHKFCMADLDSVEMSYAKTSTGFLAGGTAEEGRAFIQRTRGGDTKNISCLTKNDNRHNRFGQGGQCDGTAISIPMWLDGIQVDGSAITRVGRQNITYPSAPGSFWKAEMTTDDFYEGSRSISLVKSGVGGGFGASAFIFYRIPPEAIPGFQFYFKCPNDLGGTGTQPLFMEAYTVNLLDTDIPGVYALPDGWEDGFFGEQVVSVDQATGMTTWQKFSADGSRADTTIYFDGYARRGDHFVLITISAVSQPSGFRLLLDSFFGDAI